LLSYLLRYQLTETKAFITANNQHVLQTFPLLDLIKNDSKNLLIAIGICAPSAASFLVFYYLPIFLTTQFHYSELFSSIISTINLIFLTLFLILSGLVADKFNRKKLLMIGSILYALFAYPALYLISSNHFILIILGLALHALAWGILTSAYTAALVELFRTAIRYTGVSTSYNLANSILGGLSPYIATLLIFLSQQKLAPAYYLVFCSVLSILATISLTDRSKTSLSQID